MMRTIYFGLVLAVWLTNLSLISDAPVQAQSADCDPIIAELRKSVNNCSEINKNWICYGHTMTVVDPVDPRFKKPRDSLPITTLNNVTTLHPGGTAILHLQLQGEAESLKIIIFGGTDVDATDENNFILRIKNGDSLCRDTPPGMVVRTDDGIVGRITVNGIDIELASTVFIGLLDAATMNIVNIEGQVTVSAPNLGEIRLLPVGTQVQVVQQDHAPVSIGNPAPAAVAASAALQWLANDAEGLRLVSDPNTQTHPTIPPCGGEIAYGQPITGQNATPGQECLYTFNGATGDIVTVDVTVTDGSLDPWVDLRGPDATLVKFNNDATATDTNSLLCNEALPADGRYMIVVRPLDNASTGTFRLTLNQQQACTPPPPVCEVIRRMVIVRSAPAVDAPPPVRSVRTGTRMLPLARQPETGWLQIQLPNGEQGWINLRPADIYCDVGWPTVPLTATVTPIPPPVTACTRVQPRGWIAYQVRQGDTLGALASNRGISVTSLKEANCLVSDVIQAGTTLFVPNSLLVTPTDTPTPTATPTITPTPTDTPTITPTPTPTVTGPPPFCDPPLTLESLATDPTASSLYIVWSVIDGCDPVSGNVVVNFSSGDQAGSDISGRSGFVVIPYPASESCRLTATYTLTLNGGGRQRVSGGGDLLLRDTCPTEPSTATPTFIPVETPTSIPTETLAPVATATPTTLPTDTPTVEVATATDIPATQP